jgi:predicted ribosome quality control (RQC) complex YloA/Tae2 family protein
MEKASYYFDSVILFCLLKEFKAISDKKVRGVKRDERNNLYVLFKENTLFASVDPSFYRVHLIRNKIPQGLKNHRFEHYLRTFTVKEIRQLGMDRIFTLSFLKKDRSEEYILVFELTGPSSNIFLLDRNKKILQQFRKSRKNQEGEIYSLHGKTLRDLLKESAEHSLEEIVEGEGTSEEIERFFKKRPLWLKEVIDWKDEEKIKTAFRSILEQPLPYIHYHDRQPLYISPVKISNASQRMGSFNDAISEFYAFAERQREREQLRKAVLKKERALKKILTKLKDDLATARKRADLKTKGELILANLKEIRKGTKKITVENPYRKDTSIEIDLNPAKTPIQNAREYFKKHRKLEKSQAIIEKRIEETAEKIKDLLSIERRIPTIGDEELEELKNIFLPTRAKQVQPIHKERTFRTFSTRGGKTVLVGRDRFENERLTFGFAKGKDLFFHVREAPGSHTILVNDGKLSKEDILEAAQIAAYFSRAKHSTIVPVSYTERRYVHRSKRLGPGKVLLSHEKTVFVEPHLPPKN